MLEKGAAAGLELEEEGEEIKERAGCFCFKQKDFQNLWIAAHSLSQL